MRELGEPDLSSDHFFVGFFFNPAGRGWGFGAEDSNLTPYQALEREQRAQNKEPVFPTPPRSDRDVRPYDAGERIFI